MRKAVVCVVLVMLAFSGCAAEDYSDRIESLESSLASQAQEIETLKEQIAEQPELAQTETPEATETAEASSPFVEYNNSGPEVLFNYLPEGFVHLFDEETVTFSSVTKMTDGRYRIQLLYDVEELDKEALDAFAAAVSCVDTEWADRIVRTENVLYYMYENDNDDGGIMLNIELDTAPEGIEDLFDGELVDMDAYMLPEELLPQPDSIRISFYDEELDSVETTIEWETVSQDTAEAVAEYYMEQLSDNEWLDVSMSENGTGIFARLDEYRAIQVKAFEGKEEYSVWIIVYNYTGEDEDAE